MLYLVLLLVVASLGLLIAALTTANTLWAWISVLISVVAAGLLVLDWVRNRRKRRSRESPATGRKPAAPVVTESPRAPAPPPPPPPPQAVRQEPAENMDAFEDSFKDFDAAEPVRRSYSDTTTTSTGSFDTSSFGTGTYETPSYDNGAAETGSFEPFTDRTPPPPTREPNPSEPITAVQPPVTDLPPEPVTDMPPEPVTATHAPVVPAEIEPGEENTDATDLLVVSELSAEVVVIDERPRYHLSSCAWLGGRPTLALPVSEARELGFTPCALCSPDATLAARQRARS